MSDYCVTVTPTIMDGTVVRWYADEHALRYAEGSILSASRNGVMGHGALIPRELFDLAYVVHEAIRRGDDVSHHETHRRRSLMGEYVQVTR